jgi:hypothetical protein
MSVPLPQPSYPDRPDKELKPVFSVKEFTAGLLNPAVETVDPRLLHVLWLDTAAFRLCYTINMRVDGEAALEAITFIPIVTKLMAVLGTQLDPDQPTLC